MRILVSGNTAAVATLSREYPDHLGRLIVTGNAPRGALPWGVDNSAFSSFDCPAFLRLLGRCAGKTGLLWVVAPDVWPDARATLARFWSWLPVLREAGVPVALVAQTGAETLDVPWSEIAALFIGGENHWRQSRACADLASEAKSRGKWLHVGRVNGRPSLRWAHMLGADSVDGTGASIDRQQLRRWLAFTYNLDIERRLF